MVDVFMLNKKRSFVFDYRLWVCIATLGLFTSLSGCDKESGPKPEPPVVPVGIGKAGVWVTMGDQSRLLTKDMDATIYEATSTSTPLITINASSKLQEIEGFGASLTGSSAYVLNQKMSTTQRNILLNDLFDPNVGIGITYLRMTIGASDFSLSDFTYNDIPTNQTDFSLTNFSIEKDEDDVVPVLKKIVEICPDIRIMGSPWTAPPWMKTNASFKGGKLKTECYDVYADYFVKYIEAYADHGISIDAITPQNEPLYFTANYPCMEMQPSEQAAFIKNSLGPAFAENDVDTKIIIYDHNWDHPEYATTILNDPAAKTFVAGSAFHGYGGNVSQMSSVNTAHPDKGLYFTEVSGGEWATDFSSNLQWAMANIFIGTTKNWSKTALYWNLALDQDHGPKNNGCDNCRGVVTVNNTSGVVTKNVEYYAIGHFSKFIRKGAHRITSTISSNIASVDHVAFVNADGSRVLVLSNDGTSQAAIAVKDENAQFNYTIPAKSVVTITWEP
jgi:glucosylceramidase